MVVGASKVCCLILGGQFLWRIDKILWLIAPALFDYPKWIKWGSGAAQRISSLDLNPKMRVAKPAKTSLTTGHNFLTSSLRSVGTVS